MSRKIKKSFERKQKVTVLMLCAVCTLFCWSCQNNMGSNGEDINFLKGTKWKLAGIFDTEKGNLKVLEPKNCEKCFVLTFNTDSTLLTYDGANDFLGAYKIDFVTHNMHISYLLGTKIAPPGDGSLYIRSLEIIQSFSMKKNELKLFYNDNKNYLLFKR